MIKTVTVSELAELYRKNPQLELVDVRSPAEFAEVRVAFASNLPLDQLRPAEFLAARSGPANRPLYLICRSGKRSEMAAERLMAAGFEEVFNVVGGTLQAVQQGLPLTREKKTVSLDRQVRIVAGGLVLAGLGLGFWHWSGTVLAGLIGGGLVFAGLTDSCHMGQLLMKMPWNR